MPPADLPFDVRYCDPTDREVVDGARLPHWTQAGAVCFITWRTADSLPRAALARLAVEREEWLRARAGERSPLAPRADPERPTPAPARVAGPAGPLAERAGYVPDQAGLLSPADAAAHYRFTQSRFNRALDSGLGACPLRDPACAAVVADSLRHFDGDRYVLLDSVVMPNHVHVSAAFPDAEAMRKQCESWKHFTAVALNRTLGRSGRFWQEDSFDHLVRSDAQFAHLRGYVADNPAVAGLAPGEFRHYSRRLAAFGFSTVHANPLAERADHIPESHR